MVELETERLRMRELTLEDAPFFYELMNSPGWLQFIGDRKIHTVEDARDYLRNVYLPMYEREGYGFYVVEVPPETKPVGTCGLIRREGLADTDVGFAFLPEHSGKGYATEAAAAMLSFGKAAFFLPRIVAITTVDNAASIRVLHKIGLLHQRPIRMYDEDLLLHSETAE